MSCPWCGREFHHGGGRQPLGVVTLSDHLVTCPVRSRQREAARQADLEVIEAARRRARA